MQNFIKTLGKVVGYLPMSANTEVKVFVEDEFRLMFPDCCTNAIEGGCSMTIKELEEILSLYENDGLGGYESTVNVCDIEVVDEGTVILYGVDKTKLVLAT